MLFVLRHAGAVQAQCLNWKTGFFSPGGGVDQVARAEIQFNDGGGAALFVGGDFLFAGGAPANHIARWNGSSWSTLAQGLNGSVAVLTVYDDGSGPALYAAGSFSQAGGGPASHLAKWNGSSWSAVGGGTDGDVSALTVFDDGSGSALYAGGSFTHAGGFPASHVAKWNGSNWSSLGTGTDTDIAALAVFDDGLGSALYVGGTFTMAGGQPASHIARWNGVIWTDLGAGTDAGVLALAVSGVGGTAALYAGGAFIDAGGIFANHLARWDGTAWSTLGVPQASSPGVDDDVYALTEYDDGQGPALYIGGLFDTVGDDYSSAHHVVKWNDVSLYPLGAGANGPVYTLATFDDGGGAALYAGGAFTTTDGAPANDISRWRNSAWSELSHGNGLSDDVTSLAVFDTGTPALYAGGRFTVAGGVPANYIAKWDGSVWSALGSGMYRFLGGAAQVSALTTYNVPSPALVAGGRFDLAGGTSAIDIARWDGSSWSSLAGGMAGTSGGNHYVSALVVFDDGGGPVLVAGGFFSSAGGVPAINIARWNGSSWSPFGAGVGIGNVDNVAALAVYDDGAGRALYAGGTFTTSGGSPLSYVAKWNGSSWTSPGGGVAGSAGNTFVTSLTVFDDGSGPKLYAGGQFASAGGSAASRVARWNGSSWSALGSGVTGAVYSLGTFDDGGGTALYVGGGFTAAGGAPANGIARWDGTHWSALGSGTGLVTTQAVFDDGSGGGPDLYVGGHISTAGGLPSQGIAEWRGCAGPGVLFCFGDGIGTACPCSNSGQTHHGCENSSATGGALLAGSGTARLSADTLVLTSTGERPTAFSIFLQGNHAVGPLIYGDGLRCVGGTLRRLYSKNAVGGVVSAPQGGDLSISVRSAALGDTIPMGGTRYYQVYYRDPTPSFCPNPPGNTWNISNALSVVWNT